MKFLLYVDTGFVGARHEEEIEIDDAEWGEMSEQDRESYLQDSAADFMHNCIEYGWEEVKE